VGWPALLVALAEIPLVAWGTFLFARRLRAGQYIRPEGPKGHAAKAGTPTMAGLVPLLALTVGAGALWALGWPLGPRAGFALAAAWLGGGIGLLDDLLSQRRRSSLGLSPAQKLLLGLGAAAILFLFFPALSGVGIQVPFSRLGLPLGALPPWAVFLLLLLGFWGTTNAVNLTDGLDGLAPGAVIIVLLGLVPLLGGELAGLALVSAGAVAGFLWVNAYPAGAFLGDVGSMGLGGLVLGLSFAGGLIFLLPLLGGLFVLEALSVILQVLSYKLTGRRLFKMSPLHHHLEEEEVDWPYLLPSPGWPEPKVVVRLWLLSLAFVGLGLLAAS
jgi:phospho-N-acetylmuramoyl-pentapeptide-transferase